MDELSWIARALSVPHVTRRERVQSLWSGYGEIYRVAAGDRTAIVKSVRPPARPRSDVSHQRKCASYDVELAWYRSYAARCHARVPLLLDAHRGDGTWLLLLEDLDAAGFPERRRRAPADLDGCLAWLASFHAQHLGVAPDGLWTNGTYWHLDTRRDELAAIADPALREAAPILDARLRAARHRTLVHGDAKLANFCFGARGVAAVDFQYVGGGCAMSDVAYFLASCFDGAFDEAEHLDRYFAHLRPLIPREVEDEWRALYPIAAADFYRFYAGWAPSAWAHDTHGHRVVRDVLRAL